MTVAGNNWMWSKNNDELSCVSIISMAFPALTTLLGHLRSANTRALVLRRTKTAIGIREFAVSAAVVWNSLALELRTLSCSVQTFAQRLKKHLFISCYIWAHLRILYFAPYKCTHYYTCITNYYFHAKWQILTAPHKKPGAKEWV